MNKPKSVPIGSVTKDFIDRFGTNHPSNVHIPDTNISKNRTSNSDTVSGASPQPLYRKAFQFADAIVHHQSLIWAKYRNELYYYNSYYYQRVDFDEFTQVITNFYYEQTITHSLNFLKETYRLVRTHNHLWQVSEDEADNCIMFPNGIYDLTSGEFFFKNNNISIFSQNPPPFCTSYITCSYPSYMPTLGSFPYFNAFLNRITGSDPELINRIWEFIGYYLTPDMNKKCFIVLYGAGDSGKSVLGEFLASLFNKEAVTTISIDDFHSTAFPKKLIHHRLALSMELSADPIDSKIIRGIKNATGNDLLTANKTNFHNHCKLLFASNYPLITKSPSVEFMNRFVPIPFKYTIPENERISNLSQIFQNEASSIVYYALQAYQRLKANNYIFSGNYPKNDPELFPDFDPYGNQIALFLKSYCKIGDENDRVSTNDLFQKFQDSEFCDPDLEIEFFGKKLKQVLQCVYPSKTRSHHWYIDTVDNKKVYRWGYIGISLIEDIKTNFNVL